MLALSTHCSLSRSRRCSPWQLAVTSQKLWTGSALYKLKDVYGCDQGEQEPARGCGTADAAQQASRQADGSSTPISSAGAALGLASKVLLSDHDSREDDAGSRRCQGRSSFDGILTSSMNEGHEGHEESRQPSCPTAKLCVVCLDAGKDTVLLPCRHLCLCERCANLLAASSNKCPLCRAKVRKYLRMKL
jgi:hypothetical protein